MLLGALMFILRMKEIIFVDFLVFKYYAYLCK